MFQLIFFDYSLAGNPESSKGYVKKKEAKVSVALGHLEKPLIMSDFGKIFAS